jgi:hypothetical protein
VVEESADECGVQISSNAKVEGDFLTAGVQTATATEGIAIRSDGVGTGLSLIHKAVGEKGLKQGG